jgi:nitroimidazol reductase NimA-like FMN-containing flavoprotein (pyridoxamine 5'-phosphate oxidase superfamily)
MIPDEHREFLASHRLCVVGVGRDIRPPSLSPCYYALDGDEIIISTTATRAKAKLLGGGGGPVTLCVLHEDFPFPYLNVYGTGRIDPDGAVDVMARIGEAMMGAPLPDDARPALEERARNEQRVVLRVTPERFFSTQPIAQKRS